MALPTHRNFRSVEFSFRLACRTSLLMEESEFADEEDADFVRSLVLSSGEHAILSSESSSPSFDSSFSVADTTLSLN